MSRYRAFARLVALVGMLAATLGAATLAPTAASAAPHGQYPPPPPSMVVNKGTVKVGVSVKATGYSYTGREKVYITVTYTPKGSHRSRVVKTATVYADSKGKLNITVKMGGPGTVVISGKGSKSHKTASATVHVIDKTKGGWKVERAAFSTGTTGGSAVPMSVTHGTNGGSAAVALAGLGAMALAGSVLIARKTVRRRRARAAA